MSFQQIIIPGVVFKVGTILRHCTGQLCVAHKVVRVRVTRRGNVHDLAEVAGSLAVDELVVHYDSLIRRGIQPKVAETKTCKKFGVHRATLHRRRARR